MTFIDPPHYDPGDDRSVRASATDAHRNNIGLAQDVELIGRRVWATMRWPFRMLARLVRGI